MTNRSYLSIVVVIRIIYKQCFKRLQVLTPQELAWSQSPNIDAICCGPLHTLFLSNTGRVFSCGNNDYGQLGHELPRKRPRTLKLRMFAHSTLYISISIYEDSNCSFPQLIIHSVSFYITIEWILHINA